MAKILFTKEYRRRKLMLYIRENIMKILSLIISLFLLSDVFAQKNFTVGASFPDIQLPSLSDGRLTSLADYHGHKVILHIFASW